MLNWVNASICVSFRSELGVGSLSSNSTVLSNFKGEFSHFCSLLKVISCRMPHWNPSIKSDVSQIVSPAVSERLLSEVRVTPRLKGHTLAVSARHEQCEWVMCLFWEDSDGEMKADNTLSFLFYTADSSQSLLMFSSRFEWMGGTGKMADPRPGERGCCVCLVSTHTHIHTHTITYQPVLPVGFHLWMKKIPPTKWILAVWMAAVSHWHLALCVCLYCVRVCVCVCTHTCGHLNHVRSDENRLEKPVCFVALAVKAH